MTTTAIDMKLATRQAYDAAQATVEAVNALLVAYPGYRAQITPVLQAAQVAFDAASAADVLAYRQLETK